MPNPRIVGPDGKPFPAKSLSNQIAAAQLVGVRKAWNQVYLGNITPQKLASILQGASMGAMDYLIDLAEEMRERDMHYASVLATRIRAVTGRPIIVESVSDKSIHVDQADLIRLMIAESAFSMMMTDCLEALNSPFSAIEIGWDMTMEPWIPRTRYDGEISIPAYDHKDPHWFQYDLLTGRELRLKEQGNKEGVRLPAYKFIVHHCEIKTGLPARGGLARLVALGYCSKNFLIADRNRFTELYGIPMRIGRYGTGATPEQIQTLTDAVLGLGSDASAVMHESMQIEFQAAATGNADVFEGFAKWIDNQISKAVLGQTSTADAVSGQLGGQKEKEEVRMDIMKDDAVKLMNTLMRDLIIPAIKLNFSTIDEYPRVRIDVEDADDLQLLATSLERLVPLGLKVEQSVIRDKFGLPDPDEGAELLAPATAAAAPVDVPATPSTAMNRRLQTALAAVQTAAPMADQRRLDDALTAFADFEELQSEASTILGPLLNLLEEEGPEVLLGRLAELNPELNIDGLQEKMARLLFIADTWGRLGADAEMEQSVA